MISADRSAAICPRTSQGATKDLGESGYLHILDDVAWQARSRPQRQKSIPFARPQAGPHSWSTIAEQLQQAAPPDRLAALAEQLGLTVESLQRLGTGWSRHHQAWAFPMRNAQGDVRGIRLRRPDGRKLAIKGGREGLFVPADLGGSQLLIAEGPTDTAALLDLGFAAIGRPSCRGAVQFTAQFVRSFAADEVVIVADRDDAGRTGAEALASVLILYSRRLRIITPPQAIKDARAWIAAGGTHTDVTATIEATEPRSLGITSGGTDAQARTRKNR